MLSGMQRVRDVIDRWFDLLPAACVVLMLLILALEALIAQ